MLWKTLDDPETHEEPLLLADWRGQSKSLIENRVALDGLQVASQALRHVPEVGVWQRFATESAHRIHGFYTSAARLSSLST